MVEEAGDRGPGTGVVAEIEPQESLTEVIDVLEREYALTSSDESGRLPVWFLGKLKSLDALDEEVKTQAKLLRESIERTRNALCVRFGAEFQEQVLADAQARGKKMVRYLTGQAGTRMSQDKIVVEDEAAAVGWCEVNCPEALKVVKSVLLTELKAKVKETGEEPKGCRFEPAADQFSPKVVTETLERLAAMEYRLKEDERVLFHDLRESDAACSALPF